MNADSMLDGTTIGRLIAVLGLVIGLILLAGWVLKRTGAGLTRRGGAYRRLAVLEVRQIDPQHKLALISRDGTEHLLMLGSGHSLVIETGLTPPPPADPADPAERVRFRDALAEKSTDPDRPVLKASDRLDDGASR